MPAHTETWDPQVAIRGRMFDDVPWDRGGLDRLRV